jgi:cardiolipin synthase (CMP-forming)
VGDGSKVVANRVLTVPNVLSALRLAGVPLFLWLLLGPRQDALAIIVLAAGGITDWLDGKLARWLNQSSRLGELLDPAVDRLYILATLLAFGVREIVPWWLIAVLLVRDAVLVACLLLLRHYGYPPLEVHYLGKAATFNLLYAFPLLLLAEGDSTAAQIARPIAYAFTVWGVALYLWSGMLYLVQVAGAVRAARGG